MLFTDDAELLSTQSVAFQSFLKPTYLWLQLRQLKLAINNSFYLSKDKTFNSKSTYLHKNKNL